MTGFQLPADITETDELAYLIGTHVIVETYTAPESGKPLEHLCNCGANIESDELGWAFPIHVADEIRRHSGLESLLQPVRDRGLDR